jgi:hypothetical protein
MVLLAVVGCRWGWSSELELVMVDVTGKVSKQGAVLVSSCRLAAAGVVSVGGRQACRVGLEQRA